MSNDTILTDDHVAELLTKEASEASIKYSSMGLEAFKSTKMPANKAKPNTRFLNRIIKETTNHNAALLVKETAEAQARLEDLTEAEEKKRRKLRPTNSDIRRRQLGDITSILHGRKRRPEPESETSKATTESASAKEKHGNRHSRKDHDRKRDGTRHRDEDLKTDSRDRHSAHEAKENDRERRKHRHRSRSPGHSSSRRRYRDKSPVSDEDGGDPKRHRSRSPDHLSSQHRHRDRSPVSDGDRSRHRRHTDSKSRGKRPRDDGDLLHNVSSKRMRDGRLTRERGEDQNDHADGGSKLQQLSAKFETEKAEDSDPLDEFIGPAPPNQSSAPIVRRRGRGTVGAKTLRDNYDPKSDSNQDDGRLDFDDELEAFRDRQGLKQQRAERLRTAGFTEEEIKKCLEIPKPPGSEQNPEDVKWRKRGEQRAWDEGKEEVLYDDDD